jgi:hypothetical protein
MGGAGLEMVYYGKFVNDGTRYMDGDFFIEDGWKATRFDSAIGKALEKEIDKIMDKALK